MPSCLDGDQRGHTHGREGLGRAHGDGEGWVEGWDGIGTEYSSFEDDDSLVFTFLASLASFSLRYAMPRHALMNMNEEHIEREFFCCFVCMAFGRLLVDGWMTCADQNCLLELFSWA